MPCGNNNTYLMSARTNKKDEFYTSMQDIALEFVQGGYAKYFKEKNVLCNCNDVNSNFFKFFNTMFSRLGLKTLTAVSFGEPAYKLTKTADGIVKMPIKGDGSFESEEGIALLDACDIVCTNPPFSRMKDFLPLVIEHNKDFLLFGNINCIASDSIFPYFMQGRVHLGCSIYSGDREFAVPPDYPLDANTCRTDKNGNRFINVKSVRWLTSFKTDEVIQPLRLTERYCGNEQAYPKYINLDAIEVNPTKAIPSDYNGLMGVPLTFLDVWCPEQFEIIGIDTDMTSDGKAAVLNINGENINKYTRLIIRKRKETVS